MPDLTPLDIMGAEFPKVLRGLDPPAVRNFLQQLAGSLENLLRDRGNLRQTIHFLEEELSGYKKRESALQEALVSAEKTAEATRENANMEAQRILAEAHSLSERIVDEANGRAGTIDVAISELRGSRREVRAELRRLVEILDGVILDDQEKEKEDRSRPQIAILHRPGEQKKA